MKVRNLVIFPISSLVFFTTIQAQTIQPLQLTLEKNTTYEVKNRIIYNSSGESVFGKNYALPSTKEVTIATEEVEPSVDTFFQKAAARNLGKLQFGMVPIPAMYFQSKDKSLQLLGLTTVVKMEVVFRYNF